MTRTLDRASSLFWLAVSVSVCAESLHLGIGTFKNPGIGFITFGASGLLGILSLALFVRATLQEDEGEEKVAFVGRFWGRVLFVLLVLISYATLMPTLGYLIGTFLLMTSLFWIVERRKLQLILISSLLATLLTYVVFSKWLNCQFPEGLFGF